MRGKKIKMKKEEYTYKWYLFGCKDAGYLHEKKNNAGLTLKEKILYNFHMATCNMCRKYIKHLKIIDALLHDYFSHIKLHHESKNTIQKEINNRLS
jgi:hypothetical protein